MDPLSFTFGAVGMVDVCIKYGNILYDRCQAYKRAEIELQEATLAIENHWIKIEDQISALRSVWEALGERLQIHHNTLLQVLQGKLQVAITKIDGLIGVPEKATTLDKIIAKRGETKRLKYSLFASTSLEAIIDDLEKWQRRFDPSWFFLARMTVPAIDQQITEKRAPQNKAISTVVQLRQAHEANKKGSNTTTPIFFNDNYEIESRESIPYCTANTTDSLDHRVIIERIPVDKLADVDDATIDARDLARILSKIDPEQFGLLSCEGVIKVRNESTAAITAFDFVFSYPPELVRTVPCSLRSLLLGETRYPLNERFNLAVSLARAIVFLHSSRIVHKSIRPENIIVLQPSPEKLGTPFLVGFEKFRFAERRTTMHGDEFWEKNLYRHPRRQGLHPEDAFKMQHDIYSIGVCLLEIGLWSSFVDYSDCFSSDPNSNNIKVWKPGPDLKISEHILSKDKRRAAAGVKTILVEMARSRLPGLMGTIYSSLVVSCLTCLDKGNEGFGDVKEFEDEDGIVVGVRYIEKILFEIEKIVV